jgi:hypothetical protein
LETEIPGNGLRLCKIMVCLFDEGTSYEKKINHLILNPSPSGEGLPPLLMERGSG